MRRRRLALFVVVLAGVAGALLLQRNLRDPCTALLRRYAASYEERKWCRADADCVLDAFVARGPGVCDRARAGASDRAALADLERAWAKRSCPEPGQPCPPTAGARCERNRCVTALAR